MNPDEDAPRKLAGQTLKLAFRLQSSLLYVRKRLVIQLLAVCRQIYNEAAAYFWGGNIWRFSHDEEWEVLTRFLLTIGPNARSMIHEIEVTAPLTDIPSPEP